MRRISIFVVVVLFLTTIPAFAQHRHLSETGAKVFQCVRYYRTIQGKLECVEGREVEAQIRDNIDFVDSISRSGSGYGIGEVFPVVGGNQSLGTKGKIVAGAGIGAGAGYAIFGDARGAAGGAAAGALIGLIAGKKSDKKFDQDTGEVYFSKEKRFLRNRFAAKVRLYFNSDDGQFAKTITLSAGKSEIVSLPSGANLVLAEVESSGRWVSLAEGRGITLLSNNSGWEFSNPGSGS